jgi:hypothetical protein
MIKITSLDFNKIARKQNSLREESKSQSRNTEVNCISQIARVKFTFTKLQTIERGSGRITGDERHCYVEWHEARSRTMWASEQILSPRVAWAESDRREHNQHASDKAKCRQRQNRTGLVWRRSKAKRGRNPRWGGTLDT